MKQITRGRTWKKWIATLIRSSSRLLLAVARLCWANTKHQFMSSLPCCFSVQARLTVQDCNIGRASELCCFYHLRKLRSLKIKQVEKSQQRRAFVPDWSIIPPPSKDTCWRLVKCCNSAALLQPALRQHPGRLVVLTVASKQLKIGHCPRLSPLNPYTSPILINLLRLHSAPEGHNVCVVVCACLLLSLISILRSHPFSLVTPKRLTVQHLIQLRQPHPDTNLANCLLSGLTSAWKMFDPTNGNTVQIHINLKGPT